VCSYAIWRHLDSTFRTRRSGRGCRASASLTQQANAGRTGAVPIGQNCEDNCQPASPVPILAALPLLYRDARWIADLDPGPTRSFQSDPSRHFRMRPRQARAPLNVTGAVLAMSMFGRWRNPSASRMRFVNSIRSPLQQNACAQAHLAPAGQFQLLGKCSESQTNCQNL